MAFAPNTHGQGTQFLKASVYFLVVAHSRHELFVFPGKVYEALLLKLTEMRNPCSLPHFIEALICGVGSRVREFTFLDFVLFFFFLGHREYFSFKYLLPCQIEVSLIYGARCVLGN